VKNLLLSATLVAVGVWYLHHVGHHAASPAAEDEKQTGEIVIANAPDGTLTGRWQRPASISASSPIGGPR
jgi:hypothetical protein